MLASADTPMRSIRERADALCNSRSERHHTRPHSHDSNPGPDDVCPANPTVTSEFSSRPYFSLDSRPSTGQSVLVRNGHSFGRHDPMPILEPEPSVFPEDLLASASEVDGERRWWAVYTKARQEKALARDLFAQQIPFYLPLVPRASLIRGRRIESLLPLFKGYLFILAREEERVETLRTNRVSRLIPVDAPERLRRELWQIQQLIARRAPLVVEARLPPGRRIRVKSGPFMGIEGVVEHQRSGYRLIVEVSFLQQSVSVELDDAQLEAID
jgi:transcription antitermination factor NusG